MSIKLSFCKCFTLLEWSPFPISLSREKVLFYDFDFYYFYIILKQDYRQIRNVKWAKKNKQKQSPLKPQR